MNILKFSNKCRLRLAGFRRTELHVRELKIILLSVCIGLICGCTEYPHSLPVSATALEALEGAANEAGIDATITEVNHYVDRNEFERYFNCYKVCVVLDGEFHGKLDADKIESLGRSLHSQLVAIIEEESPSIKGQDIAGSVEIEIFENEKTQQEMILYRNEVAERRKQLGAYIICDPPAPEFLPLIKVVTSGSRSRMEYELSADSGMMGAGVLRSPRMEQLVSVVNEDDPLMTYTSAQHASFDKAIALHQMAISRADQLKYSEAVTLSENATEVVKSAFGELHMEYANSLHTLGCICRTCGAYDKAAQAFGKSLRIYHAIFGEADSGSITILSDLAGCKLMEGNYVDAESRYRQLLVRKAAYYGETDIECAATLNNLAMVYSSIHNYVEAVPLLLRAQAIIETAIGTQNESYGSTLGNLGLAYTNIGDYRRAQDCFNESISIYRVVLGESNPLFAGSLMNLGFLYFSKGEISKAEPLFQEASAIYVKVLGESHRLSASSFVNLGKIDQSKGDFVTAMNFFLKALEIYRQTVGEMHPLYANCMINISSVHVATGDPTRAVGLIQNAIEILRVTPGEGSPAHAESLVSLARVLESIEDIDGSFQRYSLATDHMSSFLNQTASILSEQQQIAMTKKMRTCLDGLIRCSVANYPSGGPTQQLVVWKGAVLVRLRGLRLAGDDPAIADAFKQLQGKTRQLSALTGAVPAPDKLDAWKSQIAELTSQKEKLDTELMRSSAVFRNAQKKVSLADVRQAIPTDDVVVDYFEYSGKQGKSLVATVIRRDIDPVMVDLGSAVDAGNAISRWRTSLGADDEAKQAGGQLRKQIWEPLLPLIGDAKLVFVSTDGVLGQLPFAALPGKADGSYLIEDHAIVMLPVPILLPKLMEREVGESKLLASSNGGKVTGLLMGDVDYDFASKITPTTPTAEPNPSGSLLLASNTVSRTRGDTTYQPLAGTGPEIDVIAKLFRSHRDVADQNLIELRGRDATESAFRASAGNAKWLHLATHGFFAPEDKKNALSAAEIAKSKSTLQMSGFDDNKHQPFVGFSPGQLSGLVFAGANRPPQPIDPLAPGEPNDDGIMTADEIAYMQLENVELAVLSACETGLGETAGGEGIIGLQRAFQLAGARTTITSLWKVDDAATQALMVEFYRNLFERKLSKLESLRQAQLWLLNNPDVIEGRNLATRGAERKVNITADTKTTADTPTRSLPAYWAAFQLSGDPR